MKRNTKKKREEDKLRKILSVKTIKEETQKEKKQRKNS